MVDVHAGDVLLYRGNGFISRAIRFLDGSEVNHATIALDPATQAEAAAHGLDTSLIARSVEGSVYVVVMRPADGADTAAAVERARSYLAAGVPYAYQQILLLAGLCALRRVPLRNRLFRRALRRTLDAAAELLNALVDRGTDVMICSEYVYRCYAETGTDLLPAGIPESFTPAGAEPVTPAGSPTPAGADGVLVEWLTTQPLPESLGAAPPGPTEDPAAVAQRAEFEIEELFAEYFVAEGEGPLPAPELEAFVPEVTDEDLLAAATALAEAARRTLERRPGREAQVAADPVSTLKGLFSTNANFVTPGDLLGTSSLSEVGRLP